MKKTLRLILGDQLNAQHSWFQKVDENIIYVLFEMRQETDYVNHHIQKVVAFFASMENFAKQLREENHQVIYWELDAKKNKQSLVENLKVVIDENKIEHFEYQLPDEYRLDEQLKSFCKAIGITSQVFDSADKSLQFSSFILLSSSAAESLTHKVLLLIGSPSVAISFGNFTFIYSSLFQVVESELFVLVQ